MVQTENAEFSFYIIWIIVVIAVTLIVLLAFIILIQSKHLRIQRKIRFLQEELIKTQKLENLGLMFSGVSHDLKNILAPITMIVENLKSELKEISPHRTSSIETESHNFDTRLGNVSDFAQKGVNILNQIVQQARHNAIASPEAVNPREVINQVFDFISVTFPASIELIKSYQPKLWPVQINSTQIYQLLLNLCINARDAIEGKGIIRISAKNYLEKNHKYVELSVCDTGKGIPVNQHQKIFEPFHSTKGPGKGSGLGLFVVKSIVDNCNGFIRLDTDNRPESAGTVFHIYFPVSTADKQS